MKILSIQEAYAEAQQAGHVPPPAVRAAAQRGLDLQYQERDASLAELALGRRLAAGLPIGVAGLARVSAAVEQLQKSLRDEARYLLHGGTAARQWLADLQKAKEPEQPQEDPRAKRRKLRHQLGMILAAHDDGAPLEAFQSHVAQHGHKAVARALYDLGAEHQEGRVRFRTSEPTKEKAPKRPKKPEPEVAKSWRPMRFRGL